MRSSTTQQRRLEGQADTAGKVEVIAHGRTAVRIGTRKLEEKEGAVDAPVFVEGVGAPLVDEVELEGDLRRPSESVASAARFAAADALVEEDTVETHFAGENKWHGRLSRKGIDPENCHDVQRKNAELRGFGRGGAAARRDGVRNAGKPFVARPTSRDTKANGSEERYPVEVEIKLDQEKGAIVVRVDNVEGLVAGIGTIRADPKRQEITFRAPALFGGVANGFGAHAVGQ